MSTKKSDAVKLLEGLLDGPMTFGEMIESLRKCDKISQAELARRLKISRAHLCDIEKGRRTVTPARAVQFAKAMGYAMTQFVEVALEDQLRDTGLKLRVRIEAA